MSLRIKSEYLKVLQDLTMQGTPNILLVSIAEQEMYHQKDGKSVKTYVISTSLKPPSCRENSWGTPLGLHRVCEIIGGDQPLGMVYRARKPINCLYWECDVEMRKKNLITSRILRLEGLQPGLNNGEGIDTFDRFVYIHGTNHEEKLGTPSSSGCIQLSNQDVIELAEGVPTGTHLFISEN